MEEEASGDGSKVTAECWWAALHSCMNVIGCFKSADGHTAEDWASFNEEWINDATDAWWKVFRFYPDSTKTLMHISLWWQNDQFLMVIISF